MPKRSPNYPAHNLEDALAFVSRLYKASGTNGSTSAVVADALGYTSLGGAARQKVAALRQYGLVANVGGKTQVSKRAVGLLTHQPADPEHRSLLREAALAPTLFREIHEKYPSAEDRHLEARLINEQDFSPDGARQVIKAYRATAAFAKLDETGYDGAGGEANGEAEEPRNQPPGTRRQDESERRDHPPRRDLGANDVPYSWLLEDAEKVEVTFIGNPGKRPTRRDLEAVIEYLEVMKKRTPEAPNNQGGGE
jgi:hypothetical protein